MLSEHACVCVFLHGDEVYFCNDIICRNSLVGSCCVNMSMLVCMCGVVSVCVLLQKLAALPLPLLNCTLACSCMLTEAITG